MQKFRQAFTAFKGKAAAFFRARGYYIALTACILVLCVAAVVAFSAPQGGEDTPNPTDAPVAYPHAFAFPFAHALAYSRFHPGAKAHKGPCAHKGFPARFRRDHLGVCSGFAAVFPHAEPMDEARRR